VSETLRLRILAGAIAVCLFGATVALAFPRNGNPKTTVTAYFTKAIGLFPQSRVRVLGVQVGRVTSVTPEGTRVRVVMKLDPDRKIPADARAVIVPISLIADRYIQLTPVYSSGPVLKDGDVIDTAHTSIPSELDDLLAQLKKLLDAVQPGTLQNPESIAAAVKNLAAALAGTGDNLSTALTGAGRLSGSITDNAAQLDATFDHLSRLLDALAKHQADLTQLNTNLAAAIGAIATEHATLDTGLQNIALLTEQLGSLVKDHRLALEQDISVLAKTTRTVVAHQDSVVRSLNWLHVLADGAEQSHYGGALDFKNGTPHIDVRDAHLFPCPPGPVPPASVCLLFGMLGIPLPVSVGPASAGVGVSAPGASSSQAAQPRAADPANLLDLLPAIPLHGLKDPPPVPSSTPPLRGFFDRLGGWLDMGLGWVW